MRWATEGLITVFGGRLSSRKEHPGAGVMLSSITKAISSLQVISSIVREGTFTDRSWPRGSGLLTTVKRSSNAWTECKCEHISRRMLNAGTDLSFKEVRPASHGALGLIYRPRRSALLTVRRGQDVSPHLLNAS
jgi:hypothetical protein